MTLSTTAISSPTDFDNDGIPNSIETNLGLDPNVAADALLDLDGDGWINLDEFRLGTELDNDQSTPLDQVNPHQKVFGSEDNGGAAFGSTLAISGNTAVIGECTQSAVAINSVYVFVFDNGIWTEQERLVDSSAEPEDRYGCQVAIDGNTVLVGAVNDIEEGSKTGSVSVFERNEGIWSLQAKLLPTPKRGPGGFGHSLSIDGDTAVIGRNDSHESYVFVRNSGSWTQQSLLTPSDGISGKFGFSVAVQGDTAIIGAPMDNSNGMNSGSAYLYTRSNGVWTEEAKIVSDDIEAYDWFGSSVAINDGTVAIGAVEYQYQAEEEGAAYIFIRTGSLWQQQAKLKASDGVDGDRFGTSVSLAGDILLVGSPHRNAYSGGAYLFSRNGGSWTELSLIEPYDVTYIDYHGSTVALSGDFALTGSKWADVNHSISGAAYFFDLDLDDDGLLNSFEISMGTDPKREDSDSDGLNDGDEVNLYHTDPMLTDTDGDGYSDGTEVNAGSDPLSGDLIPDEEIPLPLWSVVLLGAALIRIGAKLS